MIKIILLIFKVSLKIHAIVRKAIFLIERRKKCKKLLYIHTVLCKMMTSVKAYFTYKINTYYKLKAIYTFF
ncbi:hypothetical protein DC714_004030 [Salmonella enterica subsp. enterica serovar Hartford]|nr:hypothetical protein [Salmonella enterica subsp. enterica serovar Hartford]